MNLPNLGGRTSRLPLLLVLAALVSGLVGAPPASAASPTASPNRGIFGPTGQPPRVATTPPRIAASFQDVTVLSGLSFPTKVAWDAGGRMYVAEKAGRVRAFDGTTEFKPDPAHSWLRFETNVYDYWDRGLLGMTIGGGYVYALYTYNHKLGDPSPPPLWANDGCPDPPGSTTLGCIASARLSRFKINSNGTAGSEQVLIEDWCQQFPSHSVGDVRFGPDGKLYVTAGEAADFNNPDWGQSTGNPCGDPTNEGGSLRAQSPRGSRNPKTLDGTLIRLETSGAAAVGNPNINSSDPNMRRIIAYGFRNPFRFTFMGNSEVWVGDVGDYTSEEVDRLPLAPTTQKNFGWPCYEGQDRYGSFDSANLPLCVTLYTAGTAADPYYTYAHDSTDPKSYPGGDTTCPTANGSVISGVTFYKGASNYPAAYNGALFFADHSRLCIWAMQPASPGGVPDPSHVVTMLNNAAGPVDLEVGPNGDVYYVDFDGGTIHELKYLGANQPPTAVAKPKVSSGPVPLTVTFDGSASSDPDPGTSLTYDWNFGDGTAHSSVVKPAHTFTTAGTFTVTLKVTDPQGASSTDTATVNASNTPPVPTINTPAASLHWSVGQSISFSGSATDAEDGTLAPSRLSWALIMHHCTAAGCHTHIIETFPGVSSGSFSAPDHEYPSYLELTLTATDSTNTSTTVSRQLDPATVDLTFTSIPSGATLSVGTTTGTAPFTRTVVVGSGNTVTAPDQTIGGHAYTFASWSDSGPQSHVITAPPTATTYQAVFKAEAAHTCATATAGTVGAWLNKKIDTPGDADWFRFSVPRTGYALIVLGGLDADLRLDLYSSCTHLVASSQHGGTVYEAIYARLAAGTYRVKVSAIGGGVSTNPYSLRFRNLAERLQLDSRSSWAAAGRVTIVGVVMNNTSTYKRSVTVRADLFNAANVRIGSVSTPVYATILNPRARASFRMTFTPPSGYDHYTLATSGLTTTIHSLAGLVITPGARSVDGSGALHVSGTLRNANAFSVRFATVAVTLFDNMRNVVNVLRVVPASTTLRAGASTTFTAVFADHTSYQVIDYRPNGAR
ncbi:MAG: PQQ-dependent sugar dehydrogenase [Chloroflexota bacterium]|nr:PQQ-dependent sugar dehydrogenase [Chloroflexota bacterium]